ncbi:MAG: hypothetical protein M1834_000951 [Cirrosporium novae-zelandiae]|nr:MAG: hypothetical protein M1834_000951 [Cirrosporium novae-zelandiae]
MSFLQTLFSANKLQDMQPDKQKTEKEVDKKKVDKKYHATSAARKDTAVEQSRNGRVENRFYPIMTSGSIAELLKREEFEDIPLVNPEEEAENHWEKVEDEELVDDWRYVNDLTKEGNLRHMRRRDLKE